MNRTKAITAAALCALCALPAVTGASAKAAQTLPFSGVSFGPGGPGGGRFSQVGGVAVDEISEDVYVYDAGEGGHIYKFDAAGEPAAFSGLAGSNVIEGVGGAGGAEEQIAIDDSAGPDKGDIYAATNSGVKVFSSAGLPLGELSGGEMCGVAVGADGHVYVGVYPSEVKQYVPLANPVTNADNVSALHGLQGVCNVSVDTAGNVYAASWSGGVRRYPPSQFNTNGEPAVEDPSGVIDQAGRTLVSGPTGADLFVDDGNGFAEYSVTGTPTLLSHSAEAEPGRLSGSFGLAFNTTTGNAASGEVYAGAGGAVNIYGPAVTIADVTAKPVSNLGKTSATLNGSVNPDGILVSSCQFEYGTETGVYTSTAACAPAPGSGSAPVAVSAAITELSPGTTYYYRLLATDTNGTNFTAEQTFQTAQPVDSVATEAASAISKTAATLNGTLAPDGLDALYYFEYGETASYGSISPTLPGADAGSASQVEHVEVALTGLQTSTTYHYRIVAVNSLGKTYGEDRSFSTLGVPPTVDDQRPSVSSILRTSAVVAATVNSENSPTAVHVEYVASGAYAAGGANPYADGGSSPNVHVEAARGDQALRPLPLTGLLPGTTYHYRLVARNGTGITYGPDYTFTTAAATPPAVQTGQASEVTQTTATLSGAVEAQGLQTSYEFEVGIDTTYSGAKLFGNAGQSAGAVAVSATLQFLVPGTTYHYRLVATNADGTTDGPDMTFTTPGVPALISQPPTTQLIPSPTVQFPSVAGAITQPRGSGKSKHKARKRAKPRKRARHGRGAGKHRARKRGGKGK